MGAHLSISLYANDIWNTYNPTSITATIIDNEQIARLTLWASSWTSGSNSWKPMQILTRPCPPHWTCPLPRPWCWSISLPNRECVLVGSDVFREDGQTPRRPVDIQRLKPASEGLVNVTATLTEPLEIACQHYVRTLSLSSSSDQLKEERSAGPRLSAKIESYAGGKISQCPTVLGMI